jgi:hypothetical protein
MNVGNATGAANMRWAYANTGVFPGNQQGCSVPVSSLLSVANIGTRVVSCTQVCSG